MDRQFCKGIAVVLTVSVLISLASCSKQTPAKERKIISADSPWFNAETIEVSTGVDADRDVDYVYHDVVGSDEQYYILYTFGMYKTPTYDEIDWTTYDYNDYNFDIISVIDRETLQTVSTISFDDYIGDKAYYQDGKITVKEGKNENDYDPLTGDIIESRSINGYDDYTFSSFYFIGDYELETVQHQTENNHIYSDICIKAPDGYISTVSLEKPDKSVYILTILALSDTSALVLAEEGKDTTFYEFDLATSEYTVANANDYSWMDVDVISRGISSPDGTVYFSTDTGINRINAQTKTQEEVFNYNWCNFNRARIDYCDIVECSEDKIVLLTQSDVPGLYCGARADVANIIELKKTDTNPNAGKTVLELYYRQTYDFDKYTGEAIVLFNESNTDYFIEVTDRYEEADKVIDLNNADVSEISRINNGAELSNKLAIDIMNGDGPDILINVSDFSQLNNPNSLADLSPYVEDLDSDMYFTNIIEGSKTNGVLYQLPIIFKIEGIMTRTKYAGASGKGFTLEEYSAFIDDTMNGKDPILYGQATYFAMLFNAAKDEFIKDGKVDLSGPEFAELADYVQDNVFEEGIGENDYYAQYAFSPPPAACTLNCCGLGGFWSGVAGVIHNGNDLTVLGYPSLDGSGPMFSPICSVAISSQAVDVDSCGEFVKILLSYDIQTKIAMNDCFVLNRDAFRETGEAALEYYNNGGGCAANGSSFGMDLSYGRKYTQDDIDAVEECILSCSQIVSEDPNISIILIEEMPAYFLGQKTLDEVIEIAQDRIQKVLDERGLN